MKGINDGTIILNSFNHEHCLRVIEKLKVCPDILINIPEKINRFGIYSLSYYPYLNRIDMKRIDKKEPVYCNPECVIEMCPEQVFISRCVPDERYLALMNAKY
jgi:hypothetical protein